MVKHIILWNIKNEYTHEQKVEIIQNIKRELEGLRGKIPGMLEIKVYTEGFDSSNAELMLDSSFVDRDALKAYSVDPAHVAVADTFVRPFTSTRNCFDFEV